MSNKVGKGLVPALRFSEFTGNWQYKVLGRYLEEYSERVGANTELPIYSSTRTGLKPQKDYFDGKELVNEGKYGVVPEGYFVYRHMSDDATFKFNINRTGGKIVVSKEYPVFRTVDLNSEFLLHKLNGDSDFKRFAAEQEKGGTRTRLYLKTLGFWNLLLPSLAEQTRIADTLSSLDNLIAAQAKKIEALKAHKKGLMQQLFPAEGETVPRLRFPEFRGEKAKISPLQSIVRFSSGGTPSKDEASYWNGDIPWISASSMYDENISDSECKVTPLAIGNGTRIAPKGSLLILVRGSMLFNRVPMGIAVTDVAFNQDVKALSVCNSVDAGFLLFQLLALSKRIPINATGIGAGKIESNVLAELAIYLPSFIEQKKVAKCLSSLGIIITAKTKKLDALKTLKQGLMQGLFPSASEAEA